MFHFKQPTNGRYIDADPIRMHILEYGDHSNPVVVMLHGSGPGVNGYCNFYCNAQAFADAGFYVIIPDLIGFGLTDKPLDLGDYTLDLFTTTLMSGLKTLNIERCHVIGNSLGGGVALQMALNYPDFVENLILMGPGCIEEQSNYFTMPGIQRMIESSQKGFNETTFQQMLKNFVYDASILSEDFYKIRWDNVQTQPKEVLSTMKTPDLSPRLHEITSPILTFWGQNDTFMPPSGKEKCLTANEQSRLIEINACGHWVMIEYPRLFNAMSIDFLLNE